MQGYISDFTSHRVYIQFTRTPDRYNIRLKQSGVHKYEQNTTYKQSNNEATF